jgi:hypothetical protein
MPVTLNLSDKRAKAMLEVYADEKKLLYSKLDEIKIEIKEIDFLTNEILKELGDEVVKSNGVSQIFKDHNGRELAYNPKMSKAKKAQWALKSANRPLNIHEIMDIIMAKEPHLFIGDTDVKRRDYTNQISSPIGTQAREENVFYREKNEGDTYYKYGLLEWKGEIPKHATYLGQIVGILEKKNRFLYSIEITNIIAKQNNVKNIKWLKKRVSAALSKAKTNNEVDGFIKYKFGRAAKDVVWGYDYWMDENGNIKKEYMFK